MKHAIQFLHREMQRQEHNKAILVMDGAADSVADCDEAIKDCQQAITLLEAPSLSPGHVDELAGYLYESYRYGVGGVAFNGDPLPMWREFSEDPAKAKQAEAWRQVARAIMPALRDDAETLEKALARDFNRFSVDARLGTPDFILAQGAVAVIREMEIMKERRDEWFAKPADDPDQLKLPLDKDPFDTDLDEPLGTPQACDGGESCEACQ